MLTLTQAAAEVDRTRSTLFKAIKAGRLSATKDAQGHFLIDPVELHRVYVVANVSQGNKSEQRDTGNDTNEIAVLRRENELLKQQAVRDREQIARERQQADNWRQQAVMLLEHHAPVQDFNQTGGKEGSLLWRKLFGSKTNG